MDISTIRNFRKGLRALERQVELALLAQTECCGVTPAQCHLLLEVEETGEESVGQLAVKLELDASTLSRTVDGLVKAGFLLRKEDPENRRRQLVSLSAAGTEKAASINALCDAWYSGLLSAISGSEATQLLEGLPLFVKALRGWRTSAGALSCCEPGTGPRAEVTA